MNRIILFLCLIISVFFGHVESLGPAAGPAAKKEETLVTKCPNECVDVLNCVDIFVEPGTKYNLFPPKNDALSKCFCQNVQSYQLCLKCKKPEEPNYQSVQHFQNRCNDINVTGAGAGASTTQPATNTSPTNSVSSGSTNLGTTNTTLTANGSNDGNEKENKGPISKFGIAVIALVCVAGVGAFIFYTKKQKERPESMPFFGNTASSPNQYATLSATKDVSTTNLTSDYNSQYYSNTETTTVDNNQYYNQNYDSQNYNQNYNQDYNQNYNQNYNQDYNQNYNQNYQDYNNQYPAANYENEIVAPQQAALDAPPIVPPPTTYESRRESMNPNSHPTVANVTGAYVCAYKYDPQLDDELALQVNDQVQIIEEYEDGWMKAVNLTTGKEGMAPRVCIKEA